MKEKFRRILDPDIPLKERMFQLLSIIALAEFIIVSIYTIMTGGSKGHVALMLCGTAVFAGTVTLTFLKHRLRAGAAISGLLYFLLYPLTFFSSGGMYGGAPVVFTFALIYVFLVTQKWERVVSLAVCIIGTALCYIAAYLHPELLDRHTVMAEHVESFLSILLVVLLICMLFTFVTEVYLAENRIVQRQKKEIEDLHQAQKRFFSSMSHEIRTPINAIIGFNEMTLRADISNDIRENANNIEAASKILLHTINEIMDMSKLETGKFALLCRNYHITSMLSDIVSMIWIRAQEKGIEFTIEADPNLPQELYGDEVRIKQILLNLLTNAVKYTKQGSVTLSISCRKGAGSDVIMLYDVKDTGIGIREEDIPYLFTAFLRVDEQQTHSIEGTGLGLTIVKQLLDMMQGTVEVSSEYGKGSTFHIEIPQTVVDETPIGSSAFLKSAEPEKTQYQSVFTAPDRRILAVDDTQMNLKVIQKLLRETKIKVDTAGSGAEALQKTLETCYDVILMDHQMPEMDGIECMHRIKEQENGLCRNSKIVCVTANVGADMERTYLQEGFDGYLVKPIKGKTLEIELEKLLSSDPV